jgi:site-specific DNA-methyltransferase (adenine-specific)
MGSGTTAVAAIKSKRNYIGYDISDEYIKLANKRISSEREKLIDLFLNVQPNTK